MQIQYDANRAAAYELRQYLKNEDLPLRWAVGFATVPAWAAVQRQTGETFRARVELAVLELESGRAPCR